MYRALLWSQCRAQTRPDPRLFCTADNAEQRSEYDRAREQAGCRAEELFVERVKAGEPITVPAWQLGGRRAPEHVRRIKRENRSVTAWRVCADDTVVPDG
jgi:hypothetical protein